MLTIAADALGAASLAAALGVAAAGVAAAADATADATADAAGVLQAASATAAPATRHRYPHDGMTRIKTSAHVSSSTAWLATTFASVQSQ